MLRRNDGGECRMVEKYSSVEKYDGGEGIIWRRYSSVVRGKRNKARLDHRTFHD